MHALVPARPVDCGHERGAGAGSRVPLCQAPPLQSPALLCHCAPPQLVALRASARPCQVAEWNSAGWLDMAVVPSLLNVVWVACYYTVGGWHWLLLLARWLTGSCCLMRLAAFSAMFMHAMDLRL